MAKSLGDEIKRSMAWLRVGGNPATRGAADPGLAGVQGSQNPLRDLFTDLLAYVLFFLASCEERCPSVAEVREKIRALVDEQEKRAKSGEVPWESYLEARFAALSWVDELILTSTWPNRSQWQHLMLTYHGTLNAGEEFYDHLEHLPSEARDVREVYYLCLKLGFLGRLALADSANELADLRRSLYRQLSGAPNDIRQSYARLFPEAYRKPQVEKGPAPSRIHLLWYGLAILLPVLLFVTYWLILKQQGDRVLARLEAPEPVRVAVTPPVNWSSSLIEELRRKDVEVQETSRGVVITLPGVLFQVNSSALSEAGKRKVEDVALVVKRYAPERPVAVEGYASREPGTLDETNQRLSEERAKQAAEVLVKIGLRRDKVTAKGFGSSNPVAPNTTEEGRGKNRRVEIIVEKAGS
jgi:type VI secretion system protein ImpK